MWRDVAFLVFSWLKGGEDLEKCLTSVVPVAW